jgi:DNA repair protein RadC
MPSCLRSCCEPGVAGSPVLDLAHDLLARFGGVGSAAQRGHRRNPLAPRLGPARAAQFKAIVEFVRRSLIEDGRASRRVDVARGRARLPAPSRSPRFHTRPFSRCSWTARTDCLRRASFFRGTLAQTSVFPREVVKAALAQNAAGVIFAHKPSKRRRRTVAGGRASDVLAQTGTFARRHPHPRPFRGRRPAGRFLRRAGLALGLARAGPRMAYLLD